VCGRLRLRRLAGTRSSAVRRARSDLLNAVSRLAIFDEEIPREGIRVTRHFERARCSGGRTLAWIALRKGVDRGVRGLPAGLGLAQRGPMLPRPAYVSILDVAFGWHAIAVPTGIRATLPPVVRITAAMLLRAIVDARLAVYERDNNEPHAGHVLLTEVEGIPNALAEMGASGGYDPKVLDHYRLSMNDLYIWARGEGIDPPATHRPSWVYVERADVRSKLRGSGCPRKKRANSPREQGLRHAATSPAAR
jgi:hypothetical protein